jgi:hypothetical protein
MYGHCREDQWLLCQRVAMTFGFYSHYAIVRRIWFLTLLGHSVCALRGTDARAQSPRDMPDSPPGALRDQQESGVWEEPSLFPPQPSVPTSRPVQQQNEEGANAEPVIDSTIPVNNVGGLQTLGAASAFQPASQNYGLPNQRPVGLGSSFQRDLILSQVQRPDIFIPYNIKLGPIPFSLRANLDVEFSDNSVRSDQERISDISLSPRIDMTGFVRLAPSITLSLQTGIGYITYVNQSQPDRLLPIASAAINPDTGLSFNVKIGKFIVNLHDRPEVPRFQVSAVTQRDQFQYNSFSNTAGITILWDMNSRTVATFGYDHINQIALDSSAEGSDQSTESFLSSLSYKVSDALGVGFDAGLSMVNYTEDFQNSGADYHLGPTFQLRLSDYISMQGAFGYQGGSYDSGGRTGDTSELGSYFANVSIHNNLNPKFSHTLSIGHQAEQGVVSNFTESNYVHYHAGWDVIRKVSLGFFASFVDAKESGGLFAEHIRYYTIGLSAGLQLTQKAFVSLVYQFTKRETLTDETQPMDLTAERNLAFAENRVSLHLGYAF